MGDQIPQKSVAFVDAGSQNSLETYDESIMIYYYLARDFNDSDIEDEIKDAFRMFDKDGNGFISSIGEIRKC